VQVFGPNGRNGYCGLGFRPGVSRLDPELVRICQRVCQLAHLRYCALLLPTLGPVPKLSQREFQVLNWVARGKSNATIAEILGISAHTVDAHLRRIYLKLGVYDRITAAVRGLGVGLVHSWSDRSIQTT
jgi:DNA-binding CsgD family transcriptional regulator